MIFRQALPLADNSSQTSKLKELYKSTPDVVMPEPFKRNNDLGVKFWERHMWTEWVKSEKERGMFNSGVQGKGVNSSFVENMDGNRVQFLRQKEILKQARDAWCTMAACGINLKPHSDMPAPMMDYFRAWMESKCPELQLCVNHWKVDKIWQQNFSSWPGSSSGKVSGFG